MSLINQMLRDLEQRRTVGVGPSPLGGLSASGTTMQSVNFSINYGTLAILLVVLFVVGVVVAFLLGSQQAVSPQERAVTDVAKTMMPVTVKKITGTNLSPKPVILATPAKVRAVNKPKAKTDVNPKVIPAIKAESMPKIALSEVKTRESSLREVEVLDQPVEERPASISIKPVGGAEINISEEILVNTEQNISKTIRPLTDEEKSQLAFQRAVKMLGRDNQQGARLALEEALHFAPTHLRARETLAALLLNEGRMSEAAGKLRDGLQLMPGATPLAKLYARILVDQNNIVTAITVLERAAPAVSADPDYYALLAALYRQEEKYAQAAQTYQLILLQRPRVSLWWMGLALSHDAMGENEKSLDAFQRALRAGGLSVEVIKYMQARVAALTPVVPASVDNKNKSGEHGE